LFVPALALGLMILLIGMGYLLTRPRSDEEIGFGSEAAGGEQDAQAPVISAERGKRLFFTRGRCSLCHQVGNRGGVRRGPVLSEGADGPEIGVRAAARALERARAAGRPYTATDYLVESLLDPPAYLVPGFRNEMPPSHLGPPGLKPDELRSLVAYLQSLGGAVDTAAIRLPEQFAPPAATP
jgi:mono/diheme cytochrome c family protein